jgi:hypothetical protein
MWKKQSAEAVANTVKHVDVWDVRGKEHGEVNCRQDKRFIPHFGPPLWAKFKRVSETQDYNGNYLLEKPKNDLGDQVFDKNHDNRNE